MSAVFKELPLWKKIMYTAFLMIPLAIALVWIYYLDSATSVEGIAGTFLSPANNKPLVTGLIVFAAGYVVFLSVMFYSNIKEVVEHTFHKE